MIGRVLLAVLAAVGALVLAPMVLGIGTGVLAGAGIGTFGANLVFTMQYAPYAAVAAAVAVFIGVLAS